jgi:ferritin-like metal-binding protein YciE
MSIPNDLHEVFVNDLKDLHGAGHQLNLLLARMAAAATCQELKASLQERLEENEVHLVRLDYIARTLHLELSGPRGVALEDFLTTGVNEPAPGNEAGAVDAGLIQVAQKIEHYATTRYGTVRTSAGLLGYVDVVEILELSLDEQRTSAKRLVRLAESIKVDAAA